MTRIRCAYWTVGFGSAPVFGTSFQESADNLDDVVSGSFGRFRHVIANVVLQKFPHQAIDSTAGRRKALKNIVAGNVFFQAALDSFELPDNLLCPVNEVQFFSR